MRIAITGARDDVLVERGAVSPRFQSYGFDEELLNADSGSVREGE
jgi:hypothetical protein